jgi:1-acyl-sn-glycerol-3-phosphate acyltransferase
LRLFRLIGFLTSLGLLAGILIFALLLPPLRARRLRMRSLQLWSQGVLRLMGILVSEDAREQTAGTRVIVANHLSYLDIPILMARSPALFLAKAEVAKWPLLGPVGRLAGMIFVDRASLWKRAGAILEIQNKVQEGYDVVVFPEGTTSLSGPRLGSSVFFAGAFRVSRMEDVAVEFVYLDYADEEACAWLGEQDFFEHFWKFLARPKTRVKIRSEWTEPSRCRVSQRSKHAYARRWMLEGGKRLFSDPAPVTLA